MTKLRAQRIQDMVLRGMIMGGAAPAAWVSGSRRPLLTSTRLPCAACPCENTTLVEIPRRLSAVSGTPSRMTVVASLKEGCSSCSLMNSP